MKWIHNKFHIIDIFILLISVSVNMAEAILNWDRLIHKGVRSNDYEDMGNVIGIDQDYLTLMMGRHEFKIPKTAVQGFNGSEVFLKIPSMEVYKLEVKT